MLSGPSSVANRLAVEISGKTGKGLKDMKREVAGKTILTDTPVERNCSLREFVCLEKDS